jgi:hypothetical protein
VGCPRDCPHYGDKKHTLIACAYEGCTKAIGYPAWEAQQKGTKPMASRKKNVEPATTREVREWANNNGFEVGNRGRIKAEVLEAFTAKTGRPLAS